MGEKATINVEAIISSASAREFANEFGTVLSKAAREWRDDVKKMTGEGAAAGMQMALASGKSGAAVKAFIKSNIGGVYGKFMEEFRLGNIEEAEKLERILDKRTRRFQKEADSITAAFAQMQDRQARTFTEHTDQFKNKVGFLQRGLFGGLSGFADLARGGGAFAQRMGQERQGRAARKLAVMPEGHDPAEVARASRMAKMGKAMASVGKAVAGFAAVAGALLLLIKLFADLESKVKDMNKEMIGSAGAAEFGFSHVEIVSGKLSDQLERMRNETTALNSNFMAFRAGAAEQQRILAGLSQAGFTYARMNEEIQKGTKFMKSYSDITALALTYARNLGVESGEVTEKMGAFAFETGMGLRDVAEQFSIISREALLAGFVTKRFYAAVLEVTSGMAFYGVRIEETTKMLKTFDSLLGQAVGTEAFKQLVGQYKDKGAEDRIRELILKDQKFAQEQFAKAFERQIRQLGQEFGTQLGMQPKEIRDLLALDEVAMTAQLQQKGLAPEEIARFKGARLTGRAAGGGLGAMTRGMPFAGPGFDVAMAGQATKVFGGKRVDEVLRGAGTGPEGAAQLAALAQVTGKSLHELEQLSAAFTAMEGHFFNLRKVQEKMAKGTELSATDKKLLEDLRTNFGIYIDESTKKIMKGDFDSNKQLVKDTGIELANVMEAVTETTTMGEKEIEEQMTKDQQIAKEISRNITGLTNVMEQTVLGVLNDIYDTLLSMAKFFFEDDTEKVARFAAIEEARKQREAAQGDAKVAQDAEREAQKNLGAARVTGDKKKIALAQQQLDQAEELADETQRQVVVTEAATRKAVALTKEEIDAQGAGSGALINAIEQSAGVELFKSESFKKSFGTALEAALPRISREMTEASFGMKVSEAMLGLFTGQRALTREERAAGELEPKKFAEEFVAKMSGDPALLEQAGGIENVRSAAAAGMAQMMKHEDWSDMWWTDENKQEFAEMFSSAAAAALALTLPTQGDREREQADRKQETERLVEGMYEVVGALTGAKKAKDLILPAGGPPIITDAGDTLFAAQPGGPIADAMGAGGGGGTVNVNVYGGDQKKVYETVMRALKATGNA